MAAVETTFPPGPRWAKKCPDLKTTSIFFLQVIPSDAGGEAHHIRNIGLSHPIDGEKVDLFSSVCLHGPAIPFPDRFRRFEAQKAGSAFPRFHPPTSKPVSPPAETVPPRRSSSTRGGASPPDRR